MFLPVSVFWLVGLSAGQKTKLTFLTLMVSTVQFDADKDDLLASV